MEVEIYLLQIQNYCGMLSVFANHSRIIHFVALQDFLNFS